MGGSSRSSNKTKNVTNTTTTTHNTSGTAGVSGDNTGVVLSGVSNSSVNVSLTDHGAVTKAGELAELALTSNAEVSKSALDKTAEVSKNAIKSVSDSNHENLQVLAGMSGQQAKQNSANLEALRELAQAKSDGGQVQTSSQMVKVVFAVALAAVAVVYLGGKGT
ncbi:hypothetical protein AB733_20070 [Photobacterium swingsii]|uniref:Chemotaxis protein n=1 Tax=Photobacterium swingsii TaxID=680026 RepID=A0A0J8V756_9GAMM|nr:hypothetical protein [Photobacterium swingsii]KMV29076.1 hypothetical protein AB733_20070 [Photobacterium swingsii]PSW19102.1 chemotaxis protein [Photobacterium swingsii]